MEKFIFPQTNTNDVNFNRVGGMTLREYAAIQIYTQSTSISPSHAVELAETLLSALSKRPKLEVEHRALGEDTP